MIRFKSVSLCSEKTIIIIKLVKFIFKFNIAIRRVDNTKFNDEAIRLINNALAYTFKEARLATLGSSDLERIKYVGQISTSMRLITSKEGVFFILL